MKIENIKFRAWDGRNLIYSDQFSSLESFFSSTDDCGYRDTQTEYDKWTGFIDINGKSIYSGDVVTDRPKSNKGPFYLVSFYKVINKRGDDCRDDELVPNLYWPLRIVGNIRENKEFSYFKSIFE